MKIHCTKYLINDDEIKNNVLISNVIIIRFNKRNIMGILFCDFFEQFITMTVILSSSKTLLKFAHFAKGFWICLQPYVRILIVKVVKQLFLQQRFKLFLILKWVLWIQTSLTTIFNRLRDTFYVSKIGKFDFHSL